MNGGQSHINGSGNSYMMNNNGGIYSQNNGHSYSNNNGQSYVNMNGGNYHMNNGAQSGNGYSFSKYHQTNSYAPSYIQQNHDEQLLEDLPVDENMQKLFWVSEFKWVESWLTLIHFIIIS